MFIAAAVLAKICSALPLSGSIYIWAAESAGPKYAVLWLSRRLVVNHSFGRKLSGMATIALILHG